MKYWQIKTTFLNLPKYDYNCICKTWVTSFSINPNCEGGFTFDSILKEFFLLKYLTGRVLLGRMVLIKKLLLLLKLYWFHRGWSFKNYKLSGNRYMFSMYPFHSRKREGMGALIQGRALIRTLVLKEGNTVFKAFNFLCKCAQRKSCG